MDKENKYGNVTVFRSQIVSDKETGKIKTHDANLGGKDRKMVNIMFPAGSELEGWTISVDERFLHESKFGKDGNMYFFSTTKDFVHKASHFNKETNEYDYKELTFEELKTNMKLPEKSKEKAVVESLDKKGIDRTKKLSNTMG